MNMIQLLGAFLFTILLTLSLIHLYWGLGGKWASKSVLPTSETNELLFKPGFIACLLVSASLLASGLLVLIKSNFLAFSLPILVETYALPAVISIFFLRAIGDFKYVGLSRKVKNTLFAEMDRKLYTPLCILIALTLSILQYLS